MTTATIERAFNATRRLYDVAARAAHRDATTNYDDVTLAADLACDALASARGFAADYVQGQAPTAADVYKCAHDAVRYLTEAMVAAQGARHHIHTHPRVVAAAGRAIAATAAVIK